MGYEFSEIKIDDKEVAKKLTGTTLKMQSIAKKIQTAVNREVLKKAKSNAKTQFKTKNNNPDDLHNPSIFKTFRKWNAKRKPFISYVAARTLHAAVMENGAVISAKNGKYLTFKINGQWVKVKSVTIPARPYLAPAVSDVWNSNTAKEIMEQVLDKELKKYWAKKGT
jgi:hypothetical protein